MACDPAAGICRLPFKRKEENECGPGELSPLTALEDCKGQRVELTSLRGKMVALFFSAGWCPACHQFLPALKAFAAANANEVVVVFVSYDHRQVSCRDKQEFFRVPWSGPRRAMAERFQVRMLPTLVVLDGDTGALVTDWGRSAVLRNPKRCLQEWRAGRSGATWWVLLRPSFLAG
ncbi:unnamed protein product [Phaeothamnion confervicola]